MPNRLSPHSCMLTRHWCGLQVRLLAKRFYPYLTLQLQNAAPKGRNGFYAMIPQLGGPLGFIVAASLFYVLTGFLTPEEFYEFGWRFTFFAVFDPLPRSVERGSPLPVPRQ